MASLKYLAVLVLTLIWQLIGLKHWRVKLKQGARYKGKIKRFAEFGIFVELVPGLDGLVHVSNIPREKQRTFSRDYQLEQTVEVEVLDYDPSTGRIRLRIIE